MTLPFFLSRPVILRRSGSSESIGREASTLCSGGGKSESRGGRMDDVSREVRDGLEARREEVRRERRVVVGR